MLNRSTIAVVTALVGSGAIVVAGVGAAQANPQCTGAELSTYLHNDPSQAAGGAIASYVGVRNTSDHACSTGGYLGVRLADEQDHPLPTTLTRGSTAYEQDSGAHSVVLAPGASAVANLQWTGGGDVRPAALRVTFPDGSTVSVPFTEGVDRGAMAITALH